MRVYLDTAPVIYLVENIAPWEACVNAYLNRSGIVPYASALTRMECKVRPLHALEFELIADNDLFFSSLGRNLLEMRTEVLEKATELRANLNLKTPDALHLAAAIWNRCDVFLTTDKGLRRCTEIRVEVLES